jgi:hypothetical protein
LTEIEGVVRDLIEKIKRSSGIDTRFVVLDFSAKKKGTILHIEFKASSDFVARAIHQFFEKHKSGLGSSVIYTVKLLTRQIDKANAIAICNVSVAPLRHAPSHKSEQITQFLIGETADILEVESNNWVRIRLHLDGYVGWVGANQIVPVSEKEYRRWSKEKKVTTLELISGLREEPRWSSVCVREFLAGTYLPAKKKMKNWLQVGLPDGTEGWMPSSSAIRSNGNGENVSSEEIISTAKKFLGISYVWGGRSTKGFDCSGLTQTVFRLHGIELPRDASLQWKCGKDVGKDTSEFVEGDLVFFSARKNRITHVGIYLGDEGSIIHSSGFVRINSVNPSHALYDERLSTMFVGARRLGKIN